MTIGAFLYSLLAMGFCLAGITGILLGFGTAGAKFDWDDPRKMNAGNLGCLGQIITMAFVPILFGLFIGPLLLVSIFSWPQVYGYLAGAILGAALAGICALLPPWLVRRKVERLGEN
jgi:hypothetical protein